MTESILTVTVSIGRRAHERQEPLERFEWHRFIEAVARLLSDTVDGTLHVDTALSVGVWEGVSEESATFVASVPQHALRSVRAGLTWLAQEYGQQAIALTIGHTEFVTP